MTDRRASLSPTQSFSQIHLIVRKEIISASQIFNFRSRGAAKFKNLVCSYVRNYKFSVIRTERMRRLQQAKKRKKRKKEKGGAAGQTQGFLLGLFRARGCCLVNHRRKRKIIILKSQNFRLNKYENDVLSNVAGSMLFSVKTRKIYRQLVCRDSTLMSYVVIAADGEILRLAQSKFIGLGGSGSSVYRGRRGIGD